LFPLPGAQLTPSVGCAAAFARLRFGDDISEVCEGRAASGSMPLSSVPACAGSAAAIALARGGRRVIAIDRTSFPSDTLSTHVNFPSAVAEINRVGALDRVRRYDPPLCREGMVEAERGPLPAAFRGRRGQSTTASVSRATQLDMALVETARDAGAEGA